MKNFLVFRLASALAATGDIATQVRRDTERWPARSAVLGVVGAALGIRRDDTDLQRHLQTSFSVGIRVRMEGTLLRDYHTVQTVPTTSIKQPNSRRKALDEAQKKGSLNTILTEREYREGMYVEIALLPFTDAYWSIEDLIAALLQPQFVLYFGRKSCPLTSPVYPLSINAKDTLAAFKTYAALDVHKASPEAPPNDDDYMLALDSNLVSEYPIDAATIRRWDLAVDRKRWHFAEREVVIQEIRPRDSNK